MAFDTRKLLMGGSIVIAIVLIGGAYLLSGRPLPWHGTRGVSAESTDELLKTYAAKDSDKDGLPDWEEELYGTNPNDAHSVRADLTDAEAVAQGIATPKYAGQPGSASTAGNLAADVPAPDAAPGTLTDAFARLFFNNYMTSRGDAQPSQEAMQAFVTDAVAELTKTRAATDAYAATGIAVAGAGSDALRAYAVQAEQAYAKHAVQLPYSEAVYFSDAVSKSDTQALKNVMLIANSYLETTQALAAIKVPKEAASAHLAMLNAMARLAADIRDLASLNDDPIRAMLGLGAYSSDVASFTKALTDLRGVFVSAGVDPKQGDAGYSFVHLTQLAADAQTP